MCSVLGITCSQSKRVGGKKENMHSIPARACTLEVRNFVLGLVTTGTGDQSDKKQQQNRQGGTAMSMTHARHTFSRSHACLGLRSGTLATCGFGVRTSQEAHNRLSRPRSADTTLKTLNLWSGSTRGLLLIPCGTGKRTRHCAGQGAGQPCKHAWILPYASMHGYCHMQACVANATQACTAIATLACIAMARQARAPSSRQSICSVQEAHMHS